VLYPVLASVGLGFLVLASGSGVLALAIGVIVFAWWDRRPVVEVAPERA
jgi:hypothetical protein